MARRIVEMNAVSLDREKPIYEEGISKQQKIHIANGMGLFSPVPGLMR
ncbi:hypothetical protein [Cytobacillus kochii]